MSKKQTTPKFSRLRLLKTIDTFPVGDVCNRLVDLIAHFQGYIDKFGPDIQIDVIEEQEPYSSFKYQVFRIEHYVDETDEEMEIRKAEYLIQKAKQEETEKVMLQNLLLKYGKME